MLTPCAILDAAPLSVCLSRDRFRALHACQSSLIHDSQCLHLQDCSVCQVTQWSIVGRHLLSHNPRTACTARTAEAACFLPTRGGSRSHNGPYSRLLVLILRTCNERVEQSSGCFVFVELVCPRLGLGNVYVAATDCRPRPQLATCVTHDTLAVRTGSYLGSVQGRHAVWFALGLVCCWPVRPAAWALMKQAVGHAAVPRQAFLPCCAPRRVRRATCQPVVAGLQLS